MPLGSLKYYAAWDLPTRLFHWVNVACVLALAALGTAILFDEELGLTDAGKVLIKTTHVWAGYVFALNLFWRLVWAFIGNRHARWPAILPFRTGFISEFQAYISALMSGESRPYVGHNPAARAMVSVLLLLLVTQAATGLVLAGTDLYFPPFGSSLAAWIAAPGVDPSTLVPYSKTGIDPAAWDAMRAFRGPFVTVHYWTFFALLLSSVIHIAGVVVTEWREGGGIVSAMITGKKVFGRHPVDEPGPKP